MKITCPFCKVEYSAQGVPPRGFQCAVCGHVWRPPVVRGNSRGWMLALGGLVLLTAALLFVLLARRAPRAPEGPLSARIDSATPSEAGLFVSGFISNNSDELRGVPDLIVALKDAGGAELASQSFAPPAPLLDAGESVRFSVRFKSPPARASKISIELKE